MLILVFYEFSIDPINLDEGQECEIIRDFGILFVKSGFGFWNQLNDLNWIFKSPLWNSNMFDRSIIEEYFFRNDKILKVAK